MPSTVAASSCVTDLERSCRQVVVIQRPLTTWQLPVAEEERIRLPVGRQSDRLPPTGIVSRSNELAGPVSDLALNCGNSAGHGRVLSLQHI